MRTLNTFLLGAAATGAVVYVFVVALALVVATSESTLHVGVGSLVLVSVIREADTTTTVFGSGLLVVALLGGIANLAAAHALRLRRDRRAIT